MIQRYQYVFLSIALLVWASGCTVDPTPKSVSGTYREVLQSPGSELAFPIHLQTDGDSLTQMVNRYKDRFNIPWPLFIAGTSDSAQAAEQLSFLDQILSYPTSFFINRNHIIEAIHAGFNGASTGSAYYNEIQRYKQYINAIIQ